MEIHGKVKSCRCGFGWNSGSWTWKHWGKGGNACDGGKGSAL